MLLTGERLMSIAETWAEARQRVLQAPPSDAVQLTSAADGSPTISVDGTLIHSRYNPRQEAAKLVDAARGARGTVIVFGLGLGYHLQELLNRGADRLIVIEARQDVARAALDSSIVEQPDKCLLFVARDPGDIARDPGDIARDPAVVEAVAGGAELFKHPASVRLAPEYYERLEEELGRLRARQRRWKIAVVSPLYGGSLPVSRYVANALTRMGHRVDFVDNSVYYDAYRSVEERLASPPLRERVGNILILFLSELLLARAVETSPHIVLCLAQAPVQEKALRELRHRGIVTAFWFVENYRHLQYWQAVAPLYDFFFTIQEGDFFTKLRDIGVRNCAYIPTGCDPDLHRKLELTVEEQALYGSDISFAGAGYYNRRQMFEGLVDYDFKIWGTHWHGSLALRPFVQNDGAPFTTDEMVKIINASKISLNLHSSARHDATDPEGDFVNPRLFEVAACGGFQLVDMRDALPRFFEPEREVATFRNLRELREKIDFYLAHESDRLAMAERARTRALKEHTYEHRMQTMLEFILDRAGDRLQAQREKEYWSVGEVKRRPDIAPELRSFLDTFPENLPFNLRDIAEKVRQKEGDLAESEAIFMMLKDIAERQKMVEVPRQAAPP